MSSPARGRSSRHVGLRASVVAVALVGLLLAPPGTAAPSRTAGAPAGALLRSTIRPGDLDPSLAPAASASPFSVLTTLSLLNDSRFAGNALLPNGLDPTSATYDSLDLRLYVTVAGPPAGVLALTPTDPSSLRFVALHLPPDGTPGGATYDAADHRLFVTDGPADSVSVLNATAGTLETTVYLGAGTDPVAAAFDRTDDRLWVADNGTGALQYLNASSLALGKNVSVGTGPDAVAYDPRLALAIVAAGGSDVVTLVDAGSARVVGTETVGRGPDGVAYDPETSRVVVANRLSDNVSVLNGSDLVPVGSVGAGTGPGALVVSATGTVYVPNPLESNVTVFDDLDLAPFASLPTGGDPVGGAWDPYLGQIFIVDARTDDLAEIHDASASVVGRIPLGAVPEQLALVPDYPAPDEDAFAVADGPGENLSLFAADNASWVGSLSLGGLAEGLAYRDPTELWGASRSVGGGSGNLSTFATANGTELTRALLGAAPGPLAYDPATERVFVTEPLARAVAVFNGSSGSLVTIVQLGSAANGTGPSAYDVAIDPVTDDAFVSSGPANASVSVLNGSSGAVEATLATPAGPEGMSYAPNGDLYLADALAGEITVVDARSEQLLENVSVGGDPTDVAFDAFNGVLYVAQPAEGELQAVAPTNLSVLTTIPVGTAPTLLAWEPGNGELLVADPVQGSVALVGPPPSRYPVEFVETGLTLPPAGWSVLVDGVRFASDNATLTANETNGSHVYQIPSVDGLLPLPSEGSFQLDGAGRTIPVAFVSAVYNLSFVEEGLPVGHLWWVNVSGSNVTTRASTLTLSEPNGSFGYVVGAYGFYGPAKGFGSGLVLINGSDPGLVVVSFVPLPPYVAEFEEEGLPNGTAWGVEVVGTSYASNASALYVPVFNGSAPFSVPVVGPWRPTPSGGALTIQGADPPTELIRFGEASLGLYPVQFEAEGLGPGQTFQLTFNGSTQSYTLGPIFWVPAGSYPFRVHPPSGDVVMPVNGTVVVPSPSTGPGLTGGVEVDLWFNASGPSAGTTVGPFGVPWAAYVVGGALGAAAVVLFVVRPLARRTRRVDAELVRSGPGDGSPAADHPSHGYLEGEATPTEPATAEIAPDEGPGLPGDRK